MLRLNEQKQLPIKAVFLWKSRTIYSNIIISVSISMLALNSSTR